MKFTEQPMRPPQEAQSLLLRATQGCTYNKCNFCYVSRDYKFMAASPEELDAEAAEKAGGFRDDTPIYLIGSNPFALPTRLLEDYIKVLRKHVPHFSRLSMQTRIDDIAAKDDETLRKLRAAGLNYLYTGVENGDEDTLLLMNKGHTAKDTVEQLARLDRAGISYTCFYVLGLGGKGKGKKCGLATAAMFNKTHPARITTTGMTLFANAPIAQMAKNGQFTEAGEREKIEELRTFLANLQIDVFYDGIHYLNPLNYRFHNGNKYDKARVLADIDDVLATHTDEELELMVNRRLMATL